MSEFNQQDLLEKLSQRLDGLSAADREQRLRNLSQKRPDLARLLQVYLAGQAAAATQTEPSRRTGVVTWLLAGLVVVILIALAIGSFFAWRWYEPVHERLAAAERALATETFLTEVVQIAGPYMRQDGRDPLAIFADLGERELAARDGLDARVRARLALALARVHLARGDGAHAVAVLDRGVEGLDEPSSSLATELAVTRAEALAAQGELDQALAVQREALDQLDPRLIDEQAIARAEAGLAALLHRHGDLAQAEAHFESAMAVLDERDDLVGLRIHADHARLLRERGRDDELRRLQRRLDAQAPEGCETCGLVDAERSVLQAWIAAGLEGPAQASDRYELATQRVEQVLGSSHPRLAEVLLDACSNLLLAGQPSLAEPRCQRAQAISFAARGPDSELFARSSLVLAETAYRRGHLDEALAHAERARRQFEPLEAIAERYAARRLLARSQLAIGRVDFAREHGRLAGPLLASPALDVPARRVDWLLQMAEIELAANDATAAAEHLTKIDTLAGGNGGVLDSEARAAKALAQARLLAASADVEAQEKASADAAALSAIATAGTTFESNRLRVDLALYQLGQGQREQALEVLAPVLADWSPGEQAAHWAIAWAAARRAGLAADRALDGEARALLQQQRIGQAHVLAWLRQ